MDFLALAQQCAPAVHPQTMAAVARVESSFNPFAIGVVGGRLERQPRNKVEAIMTVKALEQAGYNFSLGVGQVNRHNLKKYGLDYETAFEPCPNLRAASLILKECYDRAKSRSLSDKDALHASFSCYYSGNFTTGFKADFKGQPSYVQKVVNAVSQRGEATGVTPISVLAKRTPQSSRKQARDEPVRLTATTDTTFFTADTRNGAVDSVMVFR